MSEIESVQRKIDVLAKLQDIIAKNEHFTEAERYDVRFEHDAAETELARLRAIDTSAREGGERSALALVERERVLNSVFDERTPDDVMRIFVGEHRRLHEQARGSD